MANELLNPILTQIAVKRLSGKAMSNANLSIPAESLGSSVQVSAQTVFGEAVPNDPVNSDAQLYKIQSASVDGPGTVQLVEFHLVPLSDSKYINTADVGNTSYNEIVFGQDTGQSEIDTFHAYMCVLTGSYGVDVNAIGGTYFADNASTSTSINNSPFTGSFNITGSNKLQIVPEYLSTTTADNPYKIQVSLSSSQDSFSPSDQLSLTSGIDMYFDTFAGVLFIQDPVDYATGTGTVPGKLRAFIYTGKFQDEVSTGTGGSGTGFPYSGSDSLDNNPPMAVITGSLLLEGSGHVSASGTILGNKYKIQGNVLAEMGTVNGISNTIVVGDATTPNQLGLTGKAIFANSNITASNDISASGDILASKYFVHNTESLARHGNVLQVGSNINWHGVGIGNTGRFVSIAAPLTASKDISGSGDLSITGESFFEGNITASSNISASGHISASEAIIDTIRIDDDSIRSTVDSNVILSINESGMGFEANTGDTFVFNAGGADVDFHISGENPNANLFYVNAGTNRIGMGTDSPGTFLEVSGSVKLSSISDQFQSDRYTTQGGGLVMLSSSGQLTPTIDVGVIDGAAGPTPLRFFIAHPTLAEINAATIDSSGSLTIGPNPITATNGVFSGYTSSLINSSSFNLNVAGTASIVGDITASGKLFVERVDNSGNTSYKTVVYNPTDGRFYRTGSYLGGTSVIANPGGAPTDPSLVTISIDGSTFLIPTGITGTDSQVLFFDGDDNPAGDAGMTYNKTTDTLFLGGGITHTGDTDTKMAFTDNTITFTAGGNTNTTLTSTQTSFTQDVVGSEQGIFLNDGTYNWGNNVGVGSRSGFRTVSNKSYSHLTPQSWNSRWAFVGMPLTSDGTKFRTFPSNYLVYGNRAGLSMFVNPGNEADPEDDDPGGVKPDIGGGGNPGVISGDFDQVDATGKSIGVPTIQVRGGDLEILPSGAIDGGNTAGIRIASGDVSGSFDPGIFFYNRDNKTNVSGSFFYQSASAEIRFDSASNSVKFLAGNTSESLQAILHLSKSDNSPRIGIGSSKPLSNLDIRSITASSPANLILRTNEDGIVQTGEETGRIIFAIESASYNFDDGLNFVSSGSTAAIFSRVLKSSSLGSTNHGSLIFEVNDSDNNTQPIEILTLGHGLPSNDVTKGGIFTQTNRPVALLSASLIIDDNDGPFIHIRGGTNTGNPYRIADLGVITETAGELVSAIGDNFDRGSLKLFHNSSSKVDLNSYGSADFIDTGKNLGIGTQTVPEKLTVEGNISASGTITADSLNIKGNTILGDNNGGDIIAISGSIQLTGSDGIKILSDLPGQDPSVPVGIYGTNNDLAFRGDGATEMVNMNKIHVNSGLVSTADSTKGVFLTQDGGGNQTSINIKPQTSTIIESNLFVSGSTSHITASGNISASGDVIASNLIADSASFSTRVAANEVVTAKTLVSSSAQIASDISGSFNAASASFSTRVTANDAKLTANTSNVTSAGALMDSELAEIATVKTLTAAGISGSFNAASASFSTRVTANDAKVGYTDAAVTSVINAANILSSSAQIASDISGSFTAASASLAADIVTNASNIGTTTNALTVDNATLQLNSGTTFNGSAARTISIKDGGVDSDALAANIAVTGLTTTNITASGIIDGNTNVLSLGDKDGNVGGVRAEINQNGTTSFLGNTTLKLYGNVVKINEDSEGNTARIELSGPVTASGDISSSGTITAATLDAAAVSDTLAAAIVAEIDNDEIPIAKLAEDSITIAGTSTTLGGSITADTIAGQISNDTISGNQINGGTIGSTTITALAGNLSLGDNNITNVGQISVDSINDDATGGDTNIALTGTSLTVDVGGTSILDATSTSITADVANFKATGDITSSIISASNKIITSELSAHGDLTIDADGADIILSDGGTDFGRFKRDTSDFIIKSETNNKDIVFKGVDDSSTITALTLDMSDAGKAIFNDGIVQSNNKFLTGTETGGTTRNILGINNSDVTQVANANIATNVKGTTVTTVAGGTTVFESSTTGSILPNVHQNIFDTGSLALNANSAFGDIVKFGNSSTVAGGIYYLNSSGGWSLAQANAGGTATSSLAVAVGTNSTTDGMCLRGFVNPFTDPGAGIGNPVYLSDTSQGRFQATAPNSTGDIVRILGYQYGTDLIYFNPSNDFIIHA